MCVFSFAEFSYFSRLLFARYMHSLHVFSFVSPKHCYFPQHRSNLGCHCNICVISVIMLPLSKIRRLYSLHVLDGCPTNAPYRILLTSCLYIVDYTLIYRSLEIICLPPLCTVWVPLKNITLYFSIGTRVITSCLHILFLIIIWIDIV